jgi:endonuclease VIII
MPEGDVVWRTADRLHRALAGRELTRCDLRWPSLADVDLRTRLVLQVVSWGKHLLIRCSGDPPVTLRCHLRMDGSWQIRATEPLRPDHPAPPPERRGHQVRAILANAEWTAVGHLLGLLDLVPTAAEAALVGHLGPDLLGTNWATQAAVANLTADPARPVGSALLDQRCLAGIGTVFMAEVLFCSGLCPWTPISAVTDLEAVVELARSMLRSNRDRAVRTTTGDSRADRSTWVYGRAGRPCRRCGTTVRVGRVGVPPTDRPAFHCPSCQPAR